MARQSTDSGGAAPVGPAADDRAARYARRLARLAGLTLAVHAVLAWLVYRDAADRDVSGLRWAALTMAGGLLGVAGYRRRR